MDKQNVEFILYGIVGKFIPEPDLKALWKKSKDLPLTGSLWNFDEINMTYLFFEIEKNFSINIPPSLIEKYRFNSINRIVDAIMHLVEV